MIYYTGDIHGQPKWIKAHFDLHRPGPDDILVILGDVGANFYGPGQWQDRETKKALNIIGIPILCIHGNHEMRPATLPSYLQKDWNGGLVWYEEAYPNLLFAKDGEIFTLDGIRHLVIGGAYSVDKYYRLQRGAGWWADEQPSDEIKAYVEAQVATKPFDIILSHTCPAKFRPTEAFLPGIDQSTVDDSTEVWLDRVEDVANYKLWLCGHWHIDKQVDRLRFLFHTFLTSDELKEELQD